MGKIFGLEALWKNEGLKTMVHDELVMEIDPKNAEKAKEALETLTAAMQNSTMTVNELRKALSMDPVPNIQHIAPIGDVNGVNTAFHLPIPLLEATAMPIMLNGQQLVAGRDYSLSFDSTGTVIGMTNAPQPGDVLVVVKSDTSNGQPMGGHEVSLEGVRPMQLVRSPDPPDETESVSLLQELGIEEEILKDPVPVTLEPHITPQWRRDMNEALREMREVLTIALSDLGISTQTARETVQSVLNPTNLKTIEEGFKNGKGAEVIEYLKNLVKDTRRSTKASLFGLAYGSKLPSLGLAKPMAAFSGQWQPSKPFHVGDIVKFSVGTTEEVMAVVTAVKTDGTFTAQEIPTATEADPTKEDTSDKERKRALDQEKREMWKERKRRMEQRMKLGLRRPRR